VDGFFWFSLTHSCAWCTMLCFCCSCVSECCALFGCYDLSCLARYAEGTPLLCILHGCQMFDQLLS
jgi:hypothetical protein